MKYRKINVDLNREYRNDLNWNFEQIAKDIEQSDNVSEEDKKELLEEIERVERESKERDDLLAGESLEDFLTQIRNALDGADEATENANQSATNADNKADYAKEQGDYAKSQGDYAKEQGDYANLKAEYADEKAIYANEMAGKASDEASNLSGLKDDVAEATVNANTQADYAKEQGDYAKEKGEYAESRMDIIDELIETGPVQSVNDKKGTVELNAEDVGAETPEGAQEKANTAESNANQYTDDEIEKLPKTKEDIGLGNVTNDKQATKKEFDEQRGDFTQHTKDEKAHGIGDRTTLKTTEKSTIVGALNELFTNVSDGKQLIGGAITDVDEEVEVPADATFEELASAISNMSSGKKWAEGIKESTEDRILYVNDLDFKPRAIIWWADRYVGVLVDINPFVYFRGENYYLGLVGYSDSTREFYKLSDANIDDNSFEVQVRFNEEFNWLAFE